MQDTPAAAAAEDAAPTDEARESLIESFETELGDQVLGSHIVAGDSAWVRVTQDAWREAGFIARDKLACAFFDFLSAIDWMISPFGKSEDAPMGHSLRPSTEAGAVVTGYGGGDSRFQVLARVQSLSRRHAIFIKADLPDDDLAVDSWLPVYAGVNWHEREVHEMFGIAFRGHPNLKALYLPTGFEGHPLRKDFPLLARMVKPWPGIVDVEPMPDEASGEASDDASIEAAATDGAATDGGQTDAPAADAEPSA